MPRRWKDPSDKAIKAVLSGEWRATLDPPPDTLGLLTTIAEALNACEAAGIDVRLAHGAVLTPVGYVLPVYLDPGERYTPRTMALTEFPVAQDSSDED